MVRLRLHAVCADTLSVREQGTVDSHQVYPADFIAEGVDQTRGWFFTLHAIATMVFDSISYKAVISNGLVLDKNGNKMSKRLGNAVDPFSTIEIRFRPLALVHDNQLFTMGQPEV